MINDQNKKPNTVNVCSFSPLSGPLCGRGLLSLSSAWRSRHALLPEGAGTHTEPLLLRELEHMSPPMPSFALAHHGGDGSGDSSRGPPSLHSMHSPFEAPTLKKRINSGPPPEAGKPRASRSPWLSAPLILGNEVAANVA